MTLDVKKVVQNVLMEAQGNESRALEILAEYYLATENHVDHYRDMCSYGYIYRQPRKQSKPMVLDTIYRDGALDVAQEQSPNG